MLSFEPGRQIIRFLYLFFVRSIYGALIPYMKLRGEYKALVVDACACVHARAGAARAVYG